LPDQLALSIEVLAFAKGRKQESGLSAGIRVDRRKNPTDMPGAQAPRPEDAAETEIFSSRTVLAFTLSPWCYGKHNRYDRTKSLAGIM
jgi:hypothetical protein